MLDSCLLFANKKLDEVKQVYVFDFPKSRLYLNKNNNNKMTFSGDLVTKAVVQAGGSLCNTWMQQMIIIGWLSTVNTARLKLLITTTVEYCRLCNSKMQVISKIFSS